MGLINTSARSYYADPSNYGDYQFTSLHDVINQFIVAYIGEDKLISRAKRTDVAFHAQRAMQELSFDTFKSCKAQEFIVPATLTMPLPQDYVNYTKISWVDSSGVKHLMYPTSKTSNPSSYKQDAVGSSGAMNTNLDTDFAIKAVGTFTRGSNDVVLDGDYNNIITGMNVFVENVALNGTISNVVTTSGITTITIGSNWLLKNADREIEFRLADGQLVPKTEKTARITGSYTNRDNVITASSTSEAAKVEVGMFVIDDNLPNVVSPWSREAPKVIDVQGDKITVNNNFTATIASVQINFISYDFDSETWDNYKSHKPSENNINDYQDYQNDIYWPNEGKRYGLDPQHAQVNGSYYIDCKSGKIHFSSNVSGKTVIIDYISDSLGHDDEMQVHKFAEEAMYKHIAYAILSTRPDIPEYIIRRYKKEKFAETRKAKLRLSNIKLEEITQILRGKSKQIKH